MRGVAMALIDENKKQRRILRMMRYNEEDRRFIDGVWYRRWQKADKPTKAKGDYVDRHYHHWVELD
jgi:hypothetical protein